MKVAAEPESMGLLQRSPPSHCLCQHLLIPESFAEVLYFTLSVFCWCCCADVPAASDLSIL
jgi:hypothetical protein